MLDKLKFWKKPLDPRVNHTLTKEDTEKATAARQFNAELRQFNRLLELKNQRIQALEDDLKKYYATKDKDSELEMVKLALSMLFPQHAGLINAGSSIAGANAAFTGGQPAPPTTESGRQLSPGEYTIPPDYDPEKDPSPSIHPDTVDGKPAFPFGVSPDMVRQRFKQLSKQDRASILDLANELKKSEEGEEEQA